MSVRRIYANQFNACVETSTHTSTYNNKKVVRKDILGGYGGGVPPLPIPNREVKPTCADGTAMQCGRVGSRLLLTERVLRRKSWNSFFLLVVFFLFLTILFFT